MLNTKEDMKIYMKKIGKLKMIDFHRENYGD